jgi:chorismate mutase-like protein
MNLKKLRSKIDKIDDQLIKLLAKRKVLVKTIGQLKREQGLPIFNKNREAEINKKLARDAQKFGLRLIFLKKIWLLIMREAKLVQRKLRK